MEPAYFGQLFGVTVNQLLLLEKESQFFLKKWREFVEKTARADGEMREDKNHAFRMFLREKIPKSMKKRMLIRKHGFQQAVDKLVRGSLGVPIVGGSVNAGLLLKRGASQQTRQRGNVNRTADQSAPNYKNKPEIPRSTRVPPERFVRRFVAGVLSVRSVVEPFQEENAKEDSLNSLNKTPKFKYDDKFWLLVRIFRAKYL